MTGIPVPEILVLGGFLFIYTLEELTHMILVCSGTLSGGHGHSHEEIEVPVEESIQVLFKILQFPYQVDFRQLPEDF